MSASGIVRKLTNSSPHLLPAAGTVDVKPLDSKPATHPYDNVIRLLGAIEAESNIEDKHGEICSDVAIFANTLKKTLTEYQQQGRAVTTAHLQDTINDVHRYAEAVVTKIEVISEKFGEKSVASLHGSAIIKAAQSIILALKKAEASCVYEPPSAQSLLNNMQKRHEYELKQQHPRRRKIEITEYYNILSRRAKLLFDFPLNGYCRRTSSLIGIALSFTPASKTGIDKYLNEITLAGKEICEAFATIDTGYLDSCKTILKNSQDKIQMILINATEDKQCGKDDFRPSQLRKLISELNKMTPTSARSRSAQRRSPYFAEEANRLQLNVRSRLLEDQEQESENYSSFDSRSRQVSFS